jgi:hypothetical protein
MTCNRMRIWFPVWVVVAGSGAFQPVSGYGETMPLDGAESPETLEKEQTAFVRPQVTLDPNLVDPTRPDHRGVPAPVVNSKPEEGVEGAAPPVEWPELKVHMIVASADHLAAVVTDGKSPAMRRVRVGTVLESGPAVAEIHAGGVLFRHGGEERMVPRLSCFVTLPPGAGTARPVVHEAGCTPVAGPDIVKR